MMRGFLREDGRKGIRNIVIVAYLVECAHFVARRIVDAAASPQVHLIGFPGCYPNDYALDMMKALGTHPNVGGAVLLSLGCEGFDRSQLAQHIGGSGRPVETVVIQSVGGTIAAISAGAEAIGRILHQVNASSIETSVNWSDLTIGTICGGSDGTSGITANPAVGRSFDKLIAAGATCIFEETGEMIGCEGAIAHRARTPVVADDVIAAIGKADRYYRTMGFGSFAPGNAEGGLSTQEEKSAGAYVKSGTQPIDGVIKPGEAPTVAGLYLLDVVPDGEPRFGFPNIADNAEIVEMIACGAHLTLFTTGRGSVVGSAISPVVKICANPETYKRMSDDMDIDAGRILTGDANIESVGSEIFDAVEAVASGKQTKSEAMGHFEFLLTYKTFDPPHRLDRQCA